MQVPSSGLLTATEVFQYLSMAPSFSFREAKDTTLADSENENTEGYAVGAYPTNYFVLLNIVPLHQNSRLRERFAMILAANQDATSAYAEETSKLLSRYDVAWFP